MFPRSHMLLNHRYAPFRIGQAIPGAMNSQTPGSNTLAIVQMIAQAQADPSRSVMIADPVLGNIPLSLAALQRGLDESRRVENDPNPKSEDLQPQLDFAISRGAPANIIAAFQQKIADAQRRERGGPSLDSKTLFGALTDALRASPPNQATIAELDAQLKAALDQELTTERAMRVDPVFRYLRWQKAIVDDAGPPFIEGVRQIFEEQKTGPIDSTFVNNAFASAVQRGLPDALLQRLKDQQRLLVQRDVAAAQAAGAKATTEQRRQMWQQAIAAGSPMQLVDTLKKLYDEAVARETATSEAAAIHKAASDAATTATPKPTADVATKKTEEPSRLRQLGAILLLLSPALVPMILLNLPAKR